jgi:hypothetical protein
MNIFDKFEFVKGIYAALWLVMIGWISYRSHIFLQETLSEPVFSNWYGAQESIPWNQFRHTMYPGGPVR